MKIHNDDERGGVQVGVGLSLMIEMVWWYNHEFIFNKHDEVGCYLDNQ